MNKNKKNAATRVMLRAELANPFTLIHNDLFPVANVSHWVVAELTYILDLNTS